jgi:hypothetical protein
MEFLSLPSSVASFYKYKLIPIQSFFPAAPIVVQLKICSWTPTKVAKVGLQNARDRMKGVF